MECPNSNDLASIIYCDKLWEITHLNLGIVLSAIVKEKKLGTSRTTRKDRRHRESSAGGFNRDRSNRLLFYMCTESCGRWSVIEGIYFFSTTLLARRGNTKTASDKPFKCLSVRVVAFSYTTNVDKLRNLED